MRRLAIAAAMLLGVCLPMAAQEYDFDDPVSTNRSDRDYETSNLNFGADYYPHIGDRNAARAAGYDNRGVMRYPPGDRRSRYEQNYGFSAGRLSRYGQPIRPTFDDPDPFDHPYSEPRGAHFIPPDASNFRGGRYATDYPGFRGGWYGRGHRIRIRAGEYTADDYANAFWEHQHHARAYPGEHTWNWISGQAY